MQYGLWKGKDGKEIIIDETEYEFIQKCFKNNINMSKTKDTGLNKELCEQYGLSILYGIYLPNPGGFHADNEIKEFLVSTINFLYNFFNFENETFNEMTIIDLVYVPSEIMGLNDLECIVHFSNYFPVKSELKYTEYPKKNEGFIMRPDLMFKDNFNQKRN